MVIFLSINYNKIPTRENFVKLTFFMISECLNIILYLKKNRKGATKIKFMK